MKKRMSDISSMATYQVAIDEISDILFDILSDILSDILDEISGIKIIKLEQTKKEHKTNEG